MDVKRAEGLLSSSLSWDDVQQILDKKFQGKVHLGPDRTIEPLGVGVGLQSLLGVVEPDLDSGELLLPKKFVLKIASPVAMLEAMAKEANKLPPELAKKAADEITAFVNFLIPCHNTEVTFYETLGELGNVDAVPNYFFGSKIADENSKGVMGIEFIDDVITFNPAQNFTEDQVEQALEVLAELQAKFYGQELDWPHEGLKGLYSNLSDWMLLLNNQMLGKASPDPNFTALTEKFAEIYHDIIKAEKLDHLFEKLEIKKVFVHGDFWSANFLWKKSGDGLKLQKVLDFQMSHFGLAVTDITRLLNTTLSPGERQKNWRNYLKKYHELLEKKLEGKDLPFTYEQLEKTYELAYPRTSSYLLPALTAIVQTIAGLPDSAQKAEAYQIISTKIAGIYQDIIGFHHKSN